VGEEDFKMGYRHILNLYKDQTILQFKECFSLEKIHGTSAHIDFKYEEGKLIFFPGGSKMDNFMKNFDEEALLAKFKEKFKSNVTVYGEAYGGKCQGMKDTYGPDLKFIVFDVKVDETWVSVPNAENIALNLGLEFVAYSQIPTDLNEIDRQRDLDSTQAFRNGIKERKMREGVVLRPLTEFRDNRGNRIMCKHKRDEFKETKTKREVSPEKLKIIEDTEKIADEWVTAMRLDHILSKMPECGIEHTGKIIKIMVEDVYREGKDEIIESLETRKAIGKATAKLFKYHLNNKLHK